MPAHASIGASIRRALLIVLLYEFVRAWRRRRQSAEG